MMVFCSFRCLNNCIVWYCSVIFFIGVGWCNVVGGS